MRIAAWSCLLLVTACSPGGTALRIHIDSELGVPSPLRAVDITVRPAAGPFAPEDGIGYRGVARFDVAPAAPWPLVLGIEPWRDRSPAAIEITLGPLVGGDVCAAGALVERRIPFRTGRIEDVEVMLACCTEACPQSQRCVDVSGVPTCRDNVTPTDGGSADGGTGKGGPGEGGPDDAAQVSIDGSAACATGNLLGCVRDCADLIDGDPYIAPVADGTSMTADWTFPYTAATFDRDGMILGPHAGEDPGTANITSAVSTTVYLDAIVCARLRVGRRSTRNSQIAVGMRGPTEGLEVLLALGSNLAALEWTTAPTETLDNAPDVANFATNVTLDVLLVGLGDRFYAEVAEVGAPPVSMAATRSGVPADGSAYVRAFGLEAPTVVESLVIGQPGETVKDNIW